MEAIILAGGLGTRLKDVVKDVPKPMAGVDGRPFLSYLLEYLASSGTKRVILSVGYKSEKIRDHFHGRFRGMEIEYVIEEAPLGTGGAIREGLTAVNGEDFLVLNGDTFFKLELKELMHFHLERNSILTMSLKLIRNFERYGSVSVKDGVVTGFEEKCFKNSGYINGGVYVLNKKIAGYLAGFERRFSFEMDFLGKGPHPFKVHGFISDGYFIDIGIPEDYVRAQDELKFEFRG